MAETGANAFDQWTTARPFISAYPVWAGEDATRIAAYSLYEQMYWSVPEAFKLQKRGDDTKPIYLPSGMQLVETMHRYLAPRLQIIPDPALGTPADRTNMMAWMTAFLRRERFFGMFNANKRDGLIHGDWCFIIQADMDREDGAKVSIKALDPGMVFKITDPTDDDVVIGYHLVEQTKFNGKDVIHRTTYRKETGTGGPSPITYEEALFDVDAWGGPAMEEKRQAQVVPLQTLPDPIDQLPIYHIQNRAQTGALWGSSELRGVERLITAISQGISDEELELVLNGLGVYVTDAGTPINPETGEDEPWRLGPAKVLEIGPDKKFERVTGTQSIQPWQEHIKFLIEQLDLSSSTPAVAKGMVDVTVAESGIALALKMGPIFDKAEEKETDITAVLSNMFFDLRNWFDAYESQTFGDAVCIPMYGDRLPPDRQAIFDNVMALFNAKLVSAQWAQAELAKIGWDFGDPATMLNQIAEEQTVHATVAADAFGAQIDQALGGDTGAGGGPVA